MRSDEVKPTQPRGSTRTDGRVWSIAMRAAVCRSFGEPLVVEEVDLAAPGAGELRVTLAACAICQSDLHYLQGAWGGALPAVYGHEAAGVVAELGPGVAGLAVGDHVVVTLIRSCGACATCTRGEPALCETTFRSTCAAR